MTQAPLDLEGEWKRRVHHPETLAARPSHLFDPAFGAGGLPLIGGMLARLRGRARNSYADLRASLPELDERIDAILTDPTLCSAIAAGQDGVHELAFELIALGPEYDQLISRFSAHHYLRANRDVAEAGMEPLIHYLRYGAVEGRRVLGDVHDGFSEGAQTYDPHRATCLICVHDFTRSGAPMVGLDLVRSAARTHNVIVGALRAGDMHDQFRDECMAVLVSDDPLVDFDCVLPSPVGAFEFAVLNSVECVAYIPLLTAREVPFAMYIHEYIESTTPRSKTVFASLFPDLLAFSSESVRRSWHPQLDNVGFDVARDSIVLPQRHLVRGAVTEDEVAAARARLSTLIGCEVGSRRIIYGAGYAQWRKGTDLFVLAAQMSAARYVNDQSADAPLFVWVGDGVNPEDQDFGVWMAKHLREADAGAAQGNLHLLPAGAHYGDVCKAADGMFLASRLDPLPNVVFDAVEVGAEVVLFHGATGFDDDLYSGHPSLHRVEFGRMDQVVAALDALPKKTASVATPAAKPPIDAFDEIATALLARANRPRPTSDRGELDVTIMAPAGADAAELRHKERAKIWGLDRRFVWRSADEARAEIASSENWLHRRLSIQDFETSTAPPPAFGLHIHAYYLDGLEQNIASHRAIGAASRIVVTTDTAKKQALIRSTFRNLGLNAEIIVVPNQGRDILPFMRLFNEGGPGAEHDVWCHIHQKRAVGSAASGDAWRAFLMAILLGDADAMSVAPNLIAGPGVGLVGAFDHYNVGWAASARLMPTMAPKLSGPLPAQPIVFPVGNMFWIKRPVVERMNALFGPHYHWPNEPLPHDGSVYHMIERFWPVMAAESELDAVFLSKPDQSRC